MKWRGRCGTGLLAASPVVLPMLPMLPMLLVLPVLLAAWAGPAHAASMPAVHEVFVTFDELSTRLTENIGTALGSAQVSMVVNVLFASVATGLFVWKFAGYALRGFDMLDLLTLMMTIFLVYMLLTGYRSIFPAFFDGGRYVADVLGKGIAGAANAGNASMAEAIFTSISTLDFTPSCDGLGCLGQDILSIPAAVVGHALVIVLGVAAVLVELWTRWGFQILYAVGWVTIPFLMVPRLSFLFDGWLKFFFGFIVYTMVASVNLALVLLGLQLLLAGGAAGVSTPVHGFFDFIGAMVVLAVGVATLFSTGKFASAIVANAGAGGVGEMVQKTAQTAATVAGAVVAAV